MTTVAATSHFSLKSRSSSLDLIKWLAMLTMVIDHLRLVWPDMTYLFIPGRLSFPLFCVAIAANVARSAPGELLTAANGRYLALMLLFAVISEVPYRYISNSDSVNVLVTLAIGLVIRLGMAASHVVEWGIGIDHHNNCLCTGRPVDVRLLRRTPSVSDPASHQAPRCSLAAASGSKPAE